MAGGRAANDLEEPASSLLPEIARLKEMVRGAGAGWVSMTGSGPTVFGIYPDSRAACQGYLSLSKNPGLRVFLAQGLTGRR